MDSVTQLKVLWIGSVLSSGALAIAVLILATAWRDRRIRRRAAASRHGSGLFRLDGLGFEPTGGQRRVEGRSAPGTGEPFGRPGRAALAVAAGAVTELLERWRAKRQREATIERLMAFDDHRLRDVGLERGQIRATIEQLARRPEAGRARAAPSAPASPSFNSGMRPAAARRTP
jgi:uncharacterized protein YjiS (DUF1127 family)